LQVEHPVTEMVTGLDLVELQLRVAAGEPLPFAQEDVQFTGHAIEFRVNAEDPWNDFRPSSGVIDGMPLIVRLFESAPPESPREDPGYEEGDGVPSQYDSLITKRLAYGATRADALDDADGPLENNIAGVVTNLRLLRRISHTEVFKAGGATVDWLEHNLAALLRPELGPEWWAAAGLALVHQYNRFYPRARSGPFSRSAGWLGAGPAEFWITDNQESRRVVVETAYAPEGSVIVDGESIPFRAPVRSLEGLNVGGRRLTVDHPYMGGGFVEVRDGDESHGFYPAPPPPLPRRPQAAVDGASLVVAPLSGTIAAVEVSEGDAVVEGQLLVVLEAMKMEHRLVAPAAGVVRAVKVVVRDVVREGDVLVEIGA
jgi:acetyl/propionyl-CoA carboxylase alpha subunit